RPLSRRSTGCRPARPRTAIASCGRFAPRGEAAAGDIVPDALHVIHLDTPALVDALTGARRSAPDLRVFIERGERIQLSAIVLYEWLRGPRQPGELNDQELLFPRDRAVPFG